MLRFLPAFALLAFVLLSGVSGQATTASCDEWVAISDDYDLDGAAATTVSVVPGAAFQTVSTLQISGRIMRDGSQLQGFFPVHVHVNRCDDENGGPHYMFDPEGPVDADNEIWMSFENTPNSVVTSHEQRADINGFNSVIIHTSEPGNARALCCNLRFRDIISDDIDDDDDSDSGAGVGAGLLLPAISLLVVFFAQFF